MSADSITRHRWYRFSLRTLLIGVVVLSIAFGWTAYQLNWIRERRDCMRTIELSDSIVTSRPVSAAGPLWLFGEKGQPCLDVLLEEVDPEFARIQRLFPEARVTSGILLGSAGP